MSEDKILMLHLYLQRITDYFRVKIEALNSIESDRKAQYTFKGLGLASVFQGQACVLVEAAWGIISCIVSESKSSCSLTVSCSEGRMGFPLGNYACYNMKGKAAEDWKVEIHPLLRVLFMGQLQSLAFHRGGMAMTDMCSKTIEV